MTKMLLSPFDNCYLLPPVIIVLVVFNYVYHQFLCSYDLAFMCIYIIRAVVNLLWFLSNMLRWVLIRIGCNSGMGNLKLSIWLLKKIYNMTISVEWNIYCNPHITWAGMEEIVSGVETNMGIKYLLKKIVYIRNDILWCVSNSKPKFGAHHTILHYFLIYLEQNIIS